MAGEFTDVVFQDYQDVWQDAYNIWHRNLGLPSGIQLKGKSEIYFTIDGRSPLAIILFGKSKVVKSKKARSNTL